MSFVIKTEDFLWLLFRPIVCNSLLPSPACMEEKERERHFYCREDYYTGGGGFLSSNETHARHVKEF